MYDTSHSMVDAEERLLTFCFFFSMNRRYKVRDMPVLPDENMQASIRHRKSKDSHKKFKCGYFVSIHASYEIDNMTINIQNYHLL